MNRLLPTLASPDRDQRHQIETAALKVLCHNRRRARHPGDGRVLRYTCPSPGHYPFQWFWDSCFHAVVLAHLEPEAAREELELLVAQQSPSGFLPHINFWDRRRLASPGLFWAFAQSAELRFPRRSALIQPPVLAAAVESYHATTGDLDLVRRLLPPLDRYYAYLLRERCPGNVPLLAIVAPWESGMDHRPSYDEALGLRYPASPRELVTRPRFIDLANRTNGYRPATLYRRGRFIVQDVMMSAVLADGLRTLGRLHERTGATDADWTTRADSVERAIHDHLRGPDGFFYDRDLRRGVLLRARTIAGLMPLLCESLTDADLVPLLAALDDPEQFAAPFSVPSVSVSEPSFVPGELTWGAGIMLWRGPTWINTNWLLWRALRRRGDHERAGRLAAAGAALVQRSGFREYYQPFTGAGLGAHSFGWSTLVVDMIAPRGECEDARPGQVLTESAGQARSDGGHVRPAQ
jgi:glycogen debranching enzyme